MSEPKLKLIELKNEISEKEQRDYLIDKIKKATKLELQSKEFLAEFVNIKDFDLQYELIELIKDIANDRGCKGRTKALINELQTVSTTDTRELKRLYQDLNLRLNRYGIPVTTVGNVKKIILHDPHFKNVWYNEVTNNFEYLDNVFCLEEWKGYDKSLSNVWEEEDTVKAFSYIEEKYHMKDVKRVIYDALLLVGKGERKYNPIKTIIEAEPWDETERCETFLIKWLNVKDTPLNREISRLMFAIGINRLYNSGCHAEFVFILFSLTQGTAKTVLTKCLALEEGFMTEMESIEGKDSLQKLSGTWIAALTELQALKRVKDSETFKAFLTATEDKFRLPYGRKVVNKKRQNIFIGSTNEREYIYDKTGARRFLRIDVGNTAEDGKRVFNKRYEIVQEARMCWAEALFKMKKGEMPTYYPDHLSEEFEALQQSQIVTDEIEGLVEMYLNRTRNNEICTYDIWVDGFGREKDKMQRRDSYNLIKIMDNIFKKDWERADDKKWFSEWGSQRYWIRKDPTTPRSQPEPDYEIPDSFTLLDDNKVEYDEHGIPVVF